jgi:hypothetical protein
MRRLIHAMRARCRFRLPKVYCSPATELARDPAHCFSFFFVMVRQVPKSEFEGTWVEGADRAGAGGLSW